MWIIQLYCPSYQYTHTHTHTAWCCQSNIYEHLEMLGKRKKSNSDNRTNTGKKIRPFHLYLIEFQLNWIFIHLVCGDHTSSSSSSIYYDDDDDRHSNIHLWPAAVGSSSYDFCQNNKNKKKNLPNIPGIHFVVVVVV